MKFVLPEPGVADQKLRIADDIAGIVAQLACNRAVLYFDVADFQSSPGFLSQENGLRQSRPWRQDCRQADAEEKKSHIFIQGRAPFKYNFLAASPTPFSQTQFAPGVDRARNPIDRLRLDGNPSDSSDDRISFPSALASMQHPPHSRRAFHARTLDELTASGVKLQAWSARRQFC